MAPVIYECGHEGIFPARSQETRNTDTSTEHGPPLMTERGFDTLTVEAIADAADVGKGTIYNYFKTKEDIMVTLFVDLERRVQNQVAKLSAKQQSLESLFSFVRHQFRLKRAYLPFVRIFFTEIFSYIFELQAIIDPPLSASSNHFRSGISFDGMCRWNC